jgi:hypothetical protein
VDLERLDRRQGEEGQETELDALTRLEVGLGPVTQPRDLGDVGLDDRGELGRHLERLDHVPGDRLTRPGHLLGRPAQPRGGRRSLGGRRWRGQRGGRRGRSLWCGCLLLRRSRRRGRLLGPRGLQDVLLADAAADARAVDGGQVDVVLARQLAHERRDVRAVSRRSAGGLGLRCRSLLLRRGCLLLRRGCLLLLGSGRRPGRCLLRGGPLRLGGRLGLGFGLCLRRLGRRLLGLGLAARVRGRLALLGDDRKLGSDLDGLVLGDGDAAQDP